MDTRQAVMLAVVGVATGACLCWWFIGGYYRTEPAAREKALWNRIAELQALLKVPPLFWQVWARYTHELTQPNTDEQLRGKHAATDTGTPDGGATGEASGRDNGDQS
jgi:hypothetical protein